MRRSTVMLVMLLLCSLACAYAQNQDEPGNATPPSKAPAPKPAASEYLLPRNVIVTVKTVRQFFPALDRLASTGADPSATAKTVATRTAVYASSNGAGRLTLSVDDYQYGSEASLAYEQASSKPQAPEFESIAIFNVGQQVFGGTMTQNGETQITITAQDDRLLVRLQLTGYEGTTENISKLADLARLQVSEAHARITGRRR